MLERNVLGVTAVGSQVLWEGRRGEKGWKGSGMDMPPKGFGDRGQPVSGQNEIAVRSEPFQFQGFMVTPVLISHHPLSQSHHHYLLLLGRKGHAWADMEQSSVASG